MSPNPFTPLRIFSCLAIAAVGLTSATTASARMNGISGYTGKTAGTICNQCHTGGTAPTVILTGPLSLTPGQVGAYTFRIETAAVVTGMAAAATDGVTLTLPAATNLKLLNGEAVHATPVAPTAGAAEYTFNVTAPATPGAFTIYAAGNAANQNQNPQGDLAAITTLQVLVAGTAATDGGVTPAPTPGEDGGVLADGGTAAPTSAGGPGGPSGISADSDGGNLPYYLRGTDDGLEPQFAETGCSVSAGRAEKAGLGAFVVLGLALAGLSRRRRSARDAHAEKRSGAAGE